MKIECPKCEGMGFIETKGAHSDEQRGLYWATLHNYAKKCGYSRKVADTMLHNAVLCEAYGVKEYFNYRGVVWPIPRERSSQQNTEKYGELITALMGLIDEDTLKDQA